MKQEPNHPRIDPELEARIVALVLGEASDFERAELDRLIEQRPELEAFRVRIQNVHGLLDEIGESDSTTDEDWKLPPERRSELLAVMGADSEEQPTKQVVKKNVVKRSRWISHSYRRWLAIAASVLCVLGFGASALMSLSSRQAALDAASVAVAMADKGQRLNSAGALWAENSVQSALDYEFEESESIQQTTESLPAIASDFPPANVSKSALSDIRKSLSVAGTQPSPYYLADDVQYFPSGPEFTLPREAVALRESRGLKSRLLEEQSRAPSSGRGGQQPTPPVDQLAMIDNDESARSYQLNGAGNQSGNSEAIVERSIRGESSSQGVASSSDGKQGSQPTNRPVTAEPTAPMAGIADGGTVLLGATQRPSIGQKTVTPKSDRFDDVALALEGESQGEAPASVMRWGLATESDSEEESKDSSGIARLAENAPTPSQRPKFYRDHSLQNDAYGGGFGGLKSADQPRDSIVAGKAIEGRREDDFREGNIGGFGMGGGGSTASDGFDSGVTADGTVEGLSQSRSRGSMRSGTERSANTWQSSAPERMKAGQESGIAMSAGGSYGAVQLGRPVEVPSSGPVAAKENFKKEAKKEALYEDVITDKEGFLNKGLNKPITGGFSIANGRTSNENLMENYQRPRPVTGAAIVPPPASLNFGEPQQQGGWRYSGRTANRSEPSAAQKGKNALTIPADDYITLPQSTVRGRQQPMRSELETLATRGRDYWYESVPSQLDFDLKSTKRKAAAKKSAPAAGLEEKSASQDAFSTFSLHVSDVSFKLAQAALARGEWPESSKVRIEEFVNAFDYGDPLPIQNESVACQIEQSIHPFLQQRNLLRVSMRTAAEGRSSSTPLRLTLLLDNSGSMERIDRQRTVRRAFSLLTQQLKPIDQITLISFARQPRLLADKVRGDQSSQLVELIDKLPSEGGTNIEAALQLAFEKAREHQSDGAQNRIILLTDGAVNLGDANPDSLSRRITSMRDLGIAFDAAGISAEGLNDEVLEALTRKGDGRYYLLDSEEAADDGFARQIAGALRPSAKNVKVQIEFNPNRVGHYKLLGFEKHRLKQEDFRNDKVDAAEMAAAEAGVAVYQFEAKPDGEGDVGSVSVRFRDLASGQMVEHQWPIPYQTDAPRCDQAAPSLRIAVSAALLAAKLRGEPLGETVDLKTLSNLISGLPVQDRNSKRVQQLQVMIEQARQVSGK